MQALEESLVERVPGDMLNLNLALFELRTRKNGKALPERALPLWLTSFQVAASARRGTGRGQSSRPKRFPCIIADFKFLKLSIRYLIAAQFITSRLPGKDVKRANGLAWPGSGGGGFSGRVRRIGVASLRSIGHSDPLQVFPLGKNSFPPPGSPFIPLHLTNNAIVRFFRRNQHLSCVG